MYAKWRFGMLRHSKLLRNEYKENHRLMNFRACLAFVFASENECQTTSKRV